jgi:hypothetical protein
MAASTNGLLLHLPFDEIEGGKAYDASGSNKDGVLEGTPQLVPDELFGSCLSFNEGSGAVGDHVVVPGIGLSGQTPAHTIAAWINVKAYPQRRSWILLLGQSGGGAHHWLLKPDGAMQLGVWTGAQFQPAIQKGTWTHVALVYDGQNLSCYVNGVAQGQGQPAQFNLASKDLALAKAAMGELDLSGRLAGVRIYNRALTADEIKRDMEDDQVASASFVKTHPIDFNLFDENDQQVIYIDDDPSLHSSSFEITNHSRTDINLLKPVNQTASAENHHFELRFRPGTLSAASLDKVAVAQPGWSLAKATQPDGTVSLYFLSVAGGTLKAGGKLELTLSNLSADGGDGARGTRVELRYRQLQYPNETAAITGTRIRHLSIANQTGRKNIPLHVGFAGSNTILNDGATPMDLTLRITNVLKDDNIPLNPASTSEPTKFVISFDVQAAGENKEWALGTSDEVSSIQVQCPGWTIKKEGQGVSTQWVLTHPTKNSLAPGEGIPVTLRGVKSSLLSGYTNLYLHYENIPGHWDGQFVCVIEKAPIVYRQKRVGIGTGTIDPKAKLQVAKGAIMPEVGNSEEAGILFPKDPGGGSGDAAWIRYYPRTGEATTFEIGTSNDGDDHLALMASGGVGVGTTTPEAKLHILHTNQNAHGNALIIGPTTQANLRLGYHQDYSWIQSHGLKPLAINPVGNNVAIGTASFGDVKLAVSSFQNHLQLRREATETVGGKLLFLELFQNDRSPAAVPEVYPSIRFHHGNRFWHRLEARPDGFHFKEGNLAGDSHVNVFAGNVVLNQTIGFGGSTSTNYIQKGISFVVPQNTPFRTNQQGAFWVNLQNPDGIKVVGKAGGVLATGNREVLLWGDWNGIGEVVVKGKIWAQEKNFLIQHPTRPDHNLVHGCIEGPEAGVYYRGNAWLHNGEATIQLPEYFESLTRKEGRTVLLTARGKEPFRLSYEEIQDGQFKVYGTRASGEFSWEVKAIRADVEELKAEVPKERCK